MRTPVIIQQIKKSESEGESQVLEAIVTYETPTRRSFRTYFKVWDAPGPILESADPFVIGFVAYAMLLGEDLRIVGPVDPELLTTIRENVIPLLRRWFPFLPEIELIAPEAAAPPPRTSGLITATAFAGGLDATFTTLRHRDEIDWLVTSHGYDVKTHYREYWESTLPDIRASARAVGKPLLVMESNLREISHYEGIRTRKGRINPGFYRFGRTGPIGVYLAALARTLMPFCERFFIGSTNAHDHLVPFGSHPELEPMWSTSRQQIVHDGEDCNRVQKVDYLARNFPESLANIRTCLRITPGKLNCSRCFKCLGTMAEIRLCGAEHLATGFEWPLDLEALSRADTDHAGYPLWERVRLEALEQGDHELAKAVRSAMRRPRGIRDRLLDLSPRRRDRVQMRKEWKFVCKMLKPPPGYSFEVPTPGEAALRRGDGPQPAS